MHWDLLVAVSPTMSREKFNLKKKQNWGNHRRERGDEQPRMLMALQSLGPATPETGPPLFSSQSGYLSHYITAFH